MRRLVCSFFLVALMATLWPALVAAQASHRAGLVIDFGDGNVVVRIVSFSEDSISGAELLQRSGLDVGLLVNVGGAVAVCAVQGVGCAPTPRDCFCQCQGNGCHYWSYFHLKDGAWAYAESGSAGSQLHDGDVDAWVWGDGRTLPPVLTWEDVQARAGTGLVPTVSQVSTLPTMSSTSLSTPAGAPPTATRSFPWSALAFVVMLLLLLGGGVWMRRRR